MLSEPLHGWTDFQMDGSSIYSLSHLTDIPFEWLDRAIVGLTYGHSFCVTGLLEPGELRCTVSDSGCRIEAAGKTEHSHIDAITFCKDLLHDIRQHTAQWAVFVTRNVHDPSDREYREHLLQKKCKQLKDLIDAYESAM